MNEMLIDQYPNLVDSLGKYRTDRVRYYQQGTGQRQSAAANILNKVHEPMQQFESSDAKAINDILHGVVTCIEAGSVPLSTQRLFNIFQCMPVINTREIQRMMAIDDRQARKYMQAAKLAYPFLERALCRSSLNELI